MSPKFVHRSGMCTRPESILLVTEVRRQKPSANQNKIYVTIKKKGKAKRKSKKKCLEHVELDH